MGLDRGEFWWRISRFNWFGHQSRFDRARAVLVPFAPFVTGLFVSLVMIPSNTTYTDERASSTDELPEDEFISAKAENNYPRIGRPFAPPTGYEANPILHAPEPRQ